MKGERDAEPRRRGRLPAHEREQREREILDAALAVIVERGYEATTMRDVAERAGASKETLYSWFGSREGLITALIEANADASAAAVVEMLEVGAASTGDAKRTLVRYATGLLTLLTGEASVALNRAAMSSPKLADVLLASGRHRVGPLVERFLGDLDAAGIITAPDPDAAFRDFYGLVVRDTQIRSLLGEQRPTDDEIEAHARHAVDRFLDLHS